MKNISTHAITGQSINQGQAMSRKTGNLSALSTSASIQIPNIVISFQPRAYHALDANVSKRNEMEKCGRGVERDVGFEPLLLLGRQTLYQLSYIPQIKKEDRVGSSYKMRLILSYHFQSFLLNLALFRRNKLSTAPMKPPIIMAPSKKDVPSPVMIPPANTIKMNMVAIKNLKDIIYYYFL